VRRRPSIPTLAVWLGVTVVVVTSLTLLQDLVRATSRSEQAVISGRVSETFRQAHQAHSRQEIALNALALGQHAEASQDLRNALRRVVALDPAQRPVVDALLREHRAYLRTAWRVLAEASEADGVATRDQAEVLEERIAEQTDAAAQHALDLTVVANETQHSVIRGGTITIAITILVFGSLAIMLRRDRRRLDAARTEEIQRLAEMASSDPLTGLRNHRAFQEDLGRELQRVARTGVPLALVLIDLDDLKTVNDAHGHQAGDERIRALADALRATIRGTDFAFRIGGDEFAVILPDARAWGALELTQRLRNALPGFTATAGIAEAETLRSRDDLFREADMALLGAKRLHQHAAIYTTEMDPEAGAPADDAHHTRTLASALARAVDAKDSYTRSHCQTVSELCAVIAAELGFEGDRLARMRLAGLLHDVGKIGVPDAILNKPAKLTDDEYDVMQAHSVLGYEIVEAAGLPEEARWVRHHHERVDGRGYPDRLAGQEIPLESRIILVADAFEAMTSDRPYRQAPGREFAIAELQRGAGSQFDADVVEALCRVLERSGERELLQN
jgi:diguanylate cyclase (GGDEF)-like protein/putative nucleotidyltransferase with HDIG domain